MNENYIIIAFGLSVMVVSILARGVSYGMPPHDKKPLYPMSRTQRVVLFSFGVLSLALGMARVLQG